MRLAPRRAARYRPVVTTDDGETPQTSYEAAIERLEEIIERIESGEAGLEESLGLFEEGVKLRDRCRAILDRAEQRIAELTAEEDDDAGEVAGETLA